MTDKTNEALKLAEEALENYGIEGTKSVAGIKCTEALAAIREALAEQEKQEPVAWMVTMENQDGTRKTFPLSGRYKDVRDTCDFGDPIPLYAAPVSVEAAVIAEREACAKVCETEAKEWEQAYLWDEEFAVKKCAAAIRARSEK